MALDRLPVETTIEIASHLADKDVCALAATCKSTRNAVGCNGSSLWRQLFHNQFDAWPTTTSNDVIRSRYQLRKAVLHKRKHSRFTDGSSSREKTALMVIRDIIVQSFNGNATSKNLVVLRQLCQQTDLMSRVLEPRLRNRGPLLIAVQVILSHISFDTSLETRTFGFQESQLRMYAYPHLKPMFAGKDRTDVNMDWVLHALNFFKHYLTTTHAALEWQYKGLPSGERVQPWRKGLKEGATALGKSWIGTYAYLGDAELGNIRSNSPNDDMEDCWPEGDDALQSLELTPLDPHDSKSPIPWPFCFERHLRAKSHPSVVAMKKAADQARKTRASSNHSALHKGNTTSIPQTRPKTTRAQLKQDPKAILDDGPETCVLKPDLPTVKKQSNRASGPTPPQIPPDAPIMLPFQAEGNDEEQFLAAGWTSALPPQQGFPGFQRFTMMKFFLPHGMSNPTAPDSASNMPDVADAAIDVGIDGLWAYEGVVLPGGNVIVGRWWSPSSGEGLGLEKPGEEEEGVYSGPFLWWCTDE